MCVIIVQVRLLTFMMFSKHLFQDAIGLFEKFAVFSLNKSDIHDLDDTLLSDFNTCI